MPNPRLQPLTHWPQPTLLLQIYSTMPSQPQRPQNHLPPCRPINLHYCEHLLLHPTFLPNLTNTLLPLPQRTHSTQCPTSSTATNTFTPYHQPPTTHHPHPPTLSTSEHRSSTQTARTGLTTYGISASPSSYNTLITTHPTSETHGADTSNTATVRTLSAYKPIPFKPSPMHIHSPSVLHPSGGYSSTLTCLSSLPPPPPNAPVTLSTLPYGIA